MIESGERRERKSEIAKKPSPHQIINRLWKKYEHLEMGVRRRKIVEELTAYDLPDEDLERLRREYS